MSTSLPIGCLVTVSGARYNGDPSIGQEMMSECSGRQKITTKKINTTLSKVKHHVNIWTSLMKIKFSFEYVRLNIYESADAQKELRVTTGPEKVYQILKNLACIRDSDIQILRWSSLLKEIRELDGKRVKLWIGRFRLESCLAHCVSILLETFYTHSVSHLLQSVIYWRLVQEENSRFMRFKNIDKISTQLEKKRYPILCLFSLKVENTMTPSFGVQSIKLCSRQNFTRPFCQIMARVVLHLTYVVTRD